LKDVSIPKMDPEDRRERRLTGGAMSENAQLHHFWHLRCLKEAGQYITLCKFNLK